MNDCGLPIVLASASPRRRALLASLGVEFEVMPSSAEEKEDGHSPEELVIHNARAKCKDVANRLTGPSVVIGADTLVICGDRVLSKPSDKDSARSMLRMLSGRTHCVFTGIAVLNMKDGRKAEGFEVTEVTFRTLSEEEIDTFIRVVQPLDRAGAYTVDGPGSLLVSRYNGCYYNVLGLPIVKLDDLLREVGVLLFTRIRSEQAIFL